MYRQVNIAKAFPWPHKNMVSTIPQNFYDFPVLKSMCIYGPVEFIDIFLGLMTSPTGIQTADKQISQVHFLGYTNIMV